MSQAQSHPGQKTGNSRATADSLRKAGQFAEAAEAYAAVWPDGDKWTGWAYALCLRKLKRSQDAANVAKVVVELAPDFDLGRSVYAWALSDTIRAAEELTPDLLHRAETIVELTAKSDTVYDAVSPFVPTVLRTARLLVRKGKNKQVLEWLQHLDPNRLRSDEFPTVDAEGKLRKLASQRERYHSLKTLALEKLERWEECLAAAEVALTACSPLHHDNDIWFSRRAARAKINIGDCDEGIEELTKLAARKPTSFIYCDIAEAAWKLDDPERALTNCLLALQSPGEIGYKLAALLLLARVLWRGDKKDEARRHLALYMSYRKERGWHIPGEVNAMAAEWNPLPEVHDANSLLRELKTTWREWSRSTETRRSGIVQTLLPHGRAGFIIAGDHERFFFDTRDWKDKRSKPTQGSRVSFTTKPSFDRKRQKPSVVACDIRSE